MNKKDQYLNHLDLDVQKDKKFKEIASGGVVFYRKDENDDPKFLLLKHKGVKKHWDIPKGHLKKNETKEACAIREVLEETGIPKDKLQLIKELEHKNIYSKSGLFGRKEWKIVHLYLFRSFSKEIKISHEHSDSKWLKFDRIEKKLTFPQTSFLAFVEAINIIKKI